MAYARIISGGPTGRYTVELDYGESLRLAALAATTVRLSQLDTQIAQLEVTLAEAEALEEARREKIRVLAAEIIGAASQLNDGKPGVNTLPTLPIVQEQRKLGELLAFHQPIRDQLAALKLERANWRRKAAQWNTLQTKVQKQAWCVDYTEDIPTNAYTATCDIPGDHNLVLIAAGGRVWQASDGEFRARELLSPAQCYFNAAIFPGWQKFKPTYRWGTLTAVDKDLDLATVSLAAATSSAQRLSVNQSGTLTDVPVVYMTCNAKAFEIGDRVVVQFIGQNWENPRVIGFLDNPRPCSGWQLVAAGLITLNISGPPRYLCAVFQSLTPNDQMLEKMEAATSIELDYRVNRNEWIVPDGSTSVPLTSRDWSNPPGPYGAIAGGLVITFVEPGFAPSGSFYFAGSPGSPAHLRVCFFLDSGWAPTAFSQPYFPENSIIEVRLRVNGQVFANVAVRSSFAPFAVDSGVVIPDEVTNTNQLDYVRFVENGT